MAPLPLSLRKRTGQIENPEDRISHLFLKISRKALIKKVPPVTGGGGVIRTTPTRAPLPDSREGPKARITGSEGTIRSSAGWSQSPRRASAIMTGTSSKLPEESMENPKLILSSTNPRRLSYEKV